MSMCFLDSRRMRSYGAVGGFTDPLSLFVFSGFFPVDKGLLPGYSVPFPFYRVGFNLVAEEGKAHMSSFLSPTSVLLCSFSMHKARSGKQLFFGLRFPSPRLLLYCLSARSRATRLDRRCLAMTVLFGVLPACDDRD